MVDQQARQALPSERIERIRDEASGLDGFIVVHSTRRGPAAGGCRLRAYVSEVDMLADAVRLAEGMSLKNAVAELPLGGGKAVLRLPTGQFDRVRLFEAFGRAVERLDGDYVTAEDVGTTVTDMTSVRTATMHVAGLAPEPGRAGGDPSPWTALGVFRAMEVAAGRRFGRTLGGLRVAVQGLGSVGHRLCGHLHDAGARLVVADPDRAAVARVVTRYGAVAVAPDAVLSADVDILAPCALGGILDDTSIAALRARLVCGAANNQLAGPEHGALLARRAILYAPDYLVNAGGIVSVAAEYLGWCASEVANRVEAIGPRLHRVLESAAAAGLRPEQMTDRLACTAIAELPTAPGHALRAA